MKTIPKAPVGRKVYSPFRQQSRVKMHNYRKFKNYHIEQLRDPDDARIYLSVALEDYEKDEDIEAFLLVVRDIIEAQKNNHTQHESST